VDYVYIAVAMFFSSVDYMLNISRFTHSHPKLFRATLILWTLFGVIGLFFCAVFVGMQFNVFRVSGTVSDRNATLGITQTESSPKRRNSEILCLINSLDSFAPDTARAISDTYTDTLNTKLVARMLETASQRFISDPAYTNAAEQCATDPTSAQTTPPRKSTAYAWADSPEWATLTTALRRDRTVILRVSDELDISPRLIIAGVIGEQFPIFYWTPHCIQKLL
jgi:hypothetical protein